MRRLGALRPSPAMVVALVALFAALGGSAYAAFTVTGKNVKNNSLTTKDVKNKSLLNKDFKAGQLPAGKDGKNGATSVVVRSADFTTTGSVSCGPGETATGGGVASIDTVDAFVFTSRPLQTSGKPTGWFGEVRNKTNPTTVPETGTVYVLCASP